MDVFLNKRRHYKFYEDDPQNLVGSVIKELNRQYVRVFQFEETRVINKERISKITLRYSN